jgi:membrane-bound metal-dependent hydrolase YbcI (DUF457 family)
MFAGHVGVGLAIGRVERRLNVGVFVTSALLLDFALWLFILLGWESASIPADFAATHQAQFDFPYSHSLLAAGVWSVMAAALALAWYSRLGRARWRAAVLVAAAVFSHWLLDALVHRPEMPLAGDSSAMVGLALWDNLPVALAVEAACVALGLYLFLAGSKLARGRAIGLGALSLVILAFTVIGMTVTPPPPSALAMAGSSLVTLAVVCALVAWLGRLPRQ